MTYNNCPICGCKVEYGPETCYSCTVDIVRGNPKKTQCSSCEKYYEPKDMDGNNRYSCPYCGK